MDDNAWKQHFKWGAEKNRSLVAMLKEWVQPLKEEMARREKGEKLPRDGPPDRGAPIASVVAPITGSAEGPMYIKLPTQPPSLQRTQSAPEPPTHPPPGLESLGPLAAPPKAERAAEQAAEKAGPATEGQPQEPRAELKAAIREPAAADAEEAFQWEVPTHKFKLTDRSIVSKSFIVLMGPGEEKDKVPFLVQVTAAKTGDKKGCHSFKKAKGIGKLEVNCKKRPPEGSEPIKFYFNVGGERRGPVTHNFAESSLCGLLQEDEYWDFIALENGSMQAVRITIEMPGQKLLGY